MTVKETATIAKIAFGPWPHFELTDEMLEAYHLGLQGFDYEDTYLAVGFALREADFPPVPKAIRREAARIVAKRKEKIETARKLAERKRWLSAPKADPAKVSELIQDCLGKMSSKAEVK